MIYSLTYISKSRLAKDDAQSMVDSIVQKSRENNRLHGLTGALIFTGHDFAQTLEGERCHIETLMARISEDDRHDDIRVIHEGDQWSRDFASWSMAYRGMTTFVQRHIDAARPVSADVPPDDVAVLELRSLLSAFAADSGRHA